MDAFQFDKKVEPLLKVYDPSTNSFPNAPKSINKLLEDPDFQKAIHKSMTKYLGEI